MSDVILHPPVPFPEVLAFHQEHYPEVRDFDDFIPGLTLRAAGTPTRWRSSRSTPGMRYLVPVTKHHDGFCWWDTDLTDRTSVQPGAAPRRDRGARRRVARARPRLRALPLAARLGHPDHPDRERYVDAYLRPQLARPRRAVPAPAAVGRRALGPQRRVVAGRPDRRGLLRGDGRRSGSTAASTTGSARATPTTRSTSTTCPRARRRGAWELCRGLSYSFCFNRAERDDDHLSAPRAGRDAHRGRGEGRQPAAQRRAEGRRVDPRDPDPGAARSRRVGERERRGDPRLAAVRRCGATPTPATRSARDGTVFAIDLTNATERVFPALAGVGGGRRRGRVGRARRRAARARRSGSSPGIARAGLPDPAARANRSRAVSAPPAGRRRRSAIVATHRRRAAPATSSSCPPGIHRVAGAARARRRHRARRARRDARRRRQRGPRAHRRRAGSRASRSPAARPAT